jgi:hypothetical protein
MQGAKVSTQPSTANDPVSFLTDGKPAGLRARFPKQNADRYLQGKLWKSAKNLRYQHVVPSSGGTRAGQWFTLYGSASEADRGRNTADSWRFVPIGTIDTRSLPISRFSASSLRAEQGGTH